MAQDWNELPADLLNRPVAVHWDAALNRSLPACIDDAVCNMRSALFKLKEELGLPAPPFNDIQNLLRGCG